MSEPITYVYDPNVEAELDQDWPENLSGVTFVWTTAEGVTYRGTVPDYEDGEPVPGVVMRPEEGDVNRRRIVTSGEQDAYTPWRKVYCYLQRPGVVKSIKRATHRRERREGRAEIDDQLRDIEDQP